MDVQMRVLRGTDLESIFKFLEQKNKDLDFEQQMELWNHPERKESVEFYVNTGWCLGVFAHDDELVAYSLAQAFVFKNGQTQSLWIEWVDGPKEQKKLLFEAQKKIAREKHFQKVLHSEYLVGFVNDLNEEV